MDNYTKCKSTKILEMQKDIESKTNSMGASNNRELTSTSDSEPLFRASDGKCQSDNWRA